MEVGSLALDAVCLRAALAGDGGVDEDEERSVGKQVVGRTQVELQHPLDAEISRDALVGERRVDVAVADDVAARVERGRDNRVRELGARCCEERRFGPRAHLHAFEEQPADLLTELRSAGLARRQDIVSVSAQRLGEAFRLRCLSGAVHPFEGDEHRGRTIRRVRAVVTGGAGFIGSHVVDALLARGDEVHVLDDLSLGKKANVPDGAVLHEGDIRRDCDRVFGTVSPEVCFHLAAQIDVRVSVDRPHVDADINVIGTVRVLEAARRYRTKVVFSSTGGAIYGECDGPADEDHARLPVAPYGTSKLAAEEYLATYNRLYGSSHVSLRYGNVYGPRQDPHGEAGVVAIFMRRLLEGKTPRIFGNGTQTRDYVYVGDVVAATLAAATQDGGVFNIGTGVETSVLDLYVHIQRVAGIDREPAFASPRTGELQRSVLDVTRAERQLGWKPTHSLDEALAETWAWISSE